MAFDVQPRESKREFMQQDHAFIFSPSRCSHAPLCSHTYVTSRVWLTGSNLMVRALLEPQPWQSLARFYAAAPLAVLAQVGLAKAF